MRNFWSIHVATLLLGLIAGLMLSSCVYERYESCTADRNRNREQMQLILRIGAVSGVTMQQTAEVVEIVKSLRVIIIDENGRLDVNDRIPLTAGTAKGFGYRYIRNLNAGDKHIYLIANEESVSKVMLTGDTEALADVPLTSLTAMLDYFKADAADADDGTNLTGSTFEDVLNRVYFANDYEITAGNTIALPYSACYELRLEDRTLTQTEQPMYLVPVAAKFDFVFTNYRRYDAYIDDVIISSVNSHNYLNAQLDGEEKHRKTADAVNVWWIDWLEARARGSQSAADANAYNEAWGWISRYWMPVANEPMRDVHLNPDNKEWRMDKLTDNSNPSRLNMGPFYVPESINIPAPTDGSGTSGAAGTGASQCYWLTFMVHDTMTEVTTLPGYEIDTLKALFRATHVIIYVELYESEAAIYAEIVPWDKHSFLGYVQQDEDYY